MPVSYLSAIERAPKCWVIGWREDGWPTARVPGDSRGYKTREEALAEAHKLCQRDPVFNGMEPDE